MRKTASLLLITLISTACAEFSREIEIPVAAERLVVYGYLSADDDIYAETYVSRTRPINTDNLWDFNIGDTLYEDPDLLGGFALNGAPGLGRFFFDYAEGAELRYYREGELLLRVDQPAEPYLPGIFIVTDLPAIVAGAEYRLEVSAPGYPDAVARQIAPGNVTLDSARFVPDNIAILDEEGDLRRYSRLQLFFVDPPVREDYYIAQARIEVEEPDGSIIRRRLPLSRVSSRPDGADFTTDRNWDETTPVVWEIGVENERLPPSFPFRILLYFNTVSADYFSFLESLETVERTRGDLFVEPFQLFSNVTGGYGAFYMAGRGTILTLE